MIIGSVVKSIKLGRAIERFPLACLLSIVLTSYIIVLNHGNEDPQAWVIKILIAGYIAFLAAIVTNITTEHTKHSYTNIINFLTPIGIGIITYSSIPSDILEDSSISAFRLPYQLLAWILIFHLIISFAPYLTRDKTKDFWEYNIEVLTSFIESIFFSAVLYLGLALALVAMDHLFGVSISNKVYLDLAITLMGVFNSLYFLGRFPYPNHDDQVSKPSKLFEVFVYYVLLPITLVYLGILYAYGAKLAISWSLPEGWLGKLSLCFLAIALLTYLMGYYLPTYKQGLRQFLGRFQALIPISLIVPSILLLIAIYRRLNDYGITEHRYLVAIFGVWLLFIAISKLIVPSASIKWIPISLCIIVILSIHAGPIGMFGATIKSQSKRLYNKLSAEGLIVDRQLHPYGNRTKTIRDWSELSALERRSDLSFINEWVDDDIMIDEITQGGITNWLIGHLGIESNNIHHLAIEYLNYDASFNGSLSLAGYDHLRYINSYEQSDSSSVSIDSSSRHLVIQTDIDTIMVSASEMMTHWSELEYGRRHTQQELSYPIIRDETNINLIFNYISFKIESGNPSIEYYEGIMLY